ncbi:MAG: autotransporter domain-containing protein [Alphaproteobacteria bacterium]|nr:autotransporter domain-containing protein [Alphaproteobacteria bacterium]
MKKTLLMTTALVAVISATDAYSATLNGEQPEDFIINVKRGENLEISNAYSANSNQEILWSNSVSVEEGGTLTLTETNLKSNNSENSVNINGTLIAINSILEAGNDNENDLTLANANIQGANVTLNGSDLEATKNINIADSTLNIMSNNNSYEENGIWAAEDLTIKNSNTELSQGSYLAASGNINIDSNINLDDGSSIYHISDGQTDELNITGGNINLTNYSGIYASGQNEQYNTKGASLNITGGKITATDGSEQEITLTNTSDLNIGGTAEITMNIDKIDDHNGGILHEGKSGNINISGGKITLSGNGAKIERGGYDGDWIYSTNGEPLIGDIDNYVDGKGWEIADAKGNTIAFLGDDSKIYDATGTKELGTYSSWNDVASVLLPDTEFDKDSFHISTGDINISGGEISLSNGAHISTTHKNSGDLNLKSGSLKLSGNAFVKLNNSDAKFNISGGEYKATDSDATTKGDIFISKGIITNQNSDLETFQTLHISDGTFNLSESSDLTALKGIEVTGGTINVDDGEIWSLGDINLKGGNINLTNTASINNLYENTDEIFGEITKPTKAGNISLNGAKVKVTNNSYLVSEGNIDLSGADLTMENSTLQSAGDLVFDTNGKYNIAHTDITSENGSITIKNGTFTTPEFSAPNGDVTLEGGSISEVNATLEQREPDEEIGIQNVNLNGGTFTHTNVISDGFKNLNINGGTVNLTNTEMNAWSGNVTISGGEVNLKSEGDIETGLYARKEFNVTGGTINMNGGNTIIDNINDHNKDAYPAYDLNINGGTINVNAGNGEISSSKNVNFNSGTINIAEGATLGIYGGNEKAETTALLGADGIFNIKGTLDTNIKGNGTVNFNSNNANIAGDVNMTSGGIMNVGLNKATIGGDAVFNSGSKLSLEIADADKYGSLSANSITAQDGAKLALNITKQMAVDEEISGLKLLDAATIDNKFTNELSNARYEVSNDQGTYTIKYVATASDVVNDAGGSSNNAGTAEAWDAVVADPTVSETTKEVANVLSELSKAATTNEGKKAYVDALTAIAPDAAPSVQQTQSETANQVFGAVGSRLSGGSVSQSGGGKGISSNAGNSRGMSGTRGGHNGNRGRHDGGRGGKGGHGRGHGRGMSSGDNVFSQIAVWMQGLFNKAELDDTAKSKGFDSETSGVALGIEKFVSEDAKLGIGYAYNHTDVDGFMRSTDVDTHTAIAYGEYKPSNWFVNAVATYGWSDYEENKNVAGSTVKAKYDAESFGLQAMTGYEFDVNGYSITPETGLRYVHIKQDGYKDTADQKVSGGQSDILTGVIGAKLAKSWELDNGMNLRPELRVAATYDLVNDDAGSVVTLANGSAYNVSGEALDEFGMEFGAGLTAEVNDNWELSLGYEGKFKKDYQDHSGLINAKYKF